VTPPTVRQNFIPVNLSEKVKAEKELQLSTGTHHKATECHLPYEITQY